MEDVLIIGGGFAGLAAGVALAGAGRRVRLLEQKPYLGGRARSFVDPATGSVVDNGQHMFMGCYRATLRFLNQIGTLDRVRFQPRLAITFLDPPGKATRLECADLPAPWHLLAGVIRSRSFTLREKLQIARLGRALESRRATRNGFERLSVDEWLAQLGQSEKLRRNFWDLLCIAAMNEDPRRAAAVLFERVLRLALFSSPADSRLGLARTGLSDCYTQAAADYIRAHGGQVDVDCSVSNLIVSHDVAAVREPPPGNAASEAPSSAGKIPTAPLSQIGACQGVRLASGEEVRARVVLSAIPWFQLARLLPSEVMRSEPYFARFMTLRPAPIISINLWFDRPVTDLEFAALRGTTIQWIFNKGRIFDAEIPGRGGDYVSLVLSGAHDHIGRPREELLELACRELEGLLPEARHAKLIRGLVLKERFATFSPNCHAEAARPPAITPIQGLYLAGDWTATGLPATIEGAVQSGYTAAGAIFERQPA